MNVQTVCFPLSILQTRQTGTLPMRESAEIKLQQLSDFFKAVIRPRKKFFFLIHKKLGYVRVAVAFLPLPFICIVKHTMINSL